MQNLTQIASRAGCSMWLVDLDAPLDAQGSSVLSAEENGRAGRFVFATHRERFLAGRAALRYLLAAHTGVAAERLRFAYGPQGKPELLDAPGCRFNMSHSEGVGLVAIGANDGAPIGVDVEIVRPVADATDMAKAYFDQREQAELAAASPGAAPLAFLLGWTRKEACLKALGSGFSGGSMPLTGLAMDSRVVALPPAEGFGTLAASVHSFEIGSVNAVASIALLVAAPIADGRASSPSFTEAL